MPEARAQSRLPRLDRDDHGRNHHGEPHDQRGDVDLDDRLQMRDLHRRKDEVPVPEDHRRRCAAEQRRRAQKAGEGQDREPRRAATLWSQSPGRSTRPDHRRTRGPRARDGSTRALVRRWPSKSRSPLRPQRVPRDPSAWRQTATGRTGRSASATPIRMAAIPALKRKNFTPASRETSTSVKTIPRPRWVRKRNRTTGQVRLVGQVGRGGRQ